MDHTSGLPGRKGFNTGASIGLGAAFGIVLSQVFFDGNIIFGIIFGPAVGIIIGVISQGLGRRWLYALAGALVGLAGGVFLGLGAGLFHGAYAARIGDPHVLSLLGLPYKEGYVLLAAGIASIAGFLIGTITGIWKNQANIG